MNNRTYKVEKGIPIPEPKGGRHRGEFAKVLASLTKGQSVHRAGITQTYAYVAAMRYIGKGKYTVRQEDGGFRIWRTK